MAASLKVQDLFNVRDKNVVEYLPLVLGVIGYLGADFHFQNIARGVIDSRDVIYFLSVIFISLFGAHLAMQEKE